MSDLLSQFSRLLIDYTRLRQETGILSFVSGSPDPENFVNPLTIIWLDQIHRHDGSLVAIPSKPDLIQGNCRKFAILRSYGRFPEAMQAPLAAVPAFDPRFHGVETFCCLPAWPALAARPAGSFSRQGKGHADAMFFG
jgi:hypothetical protein